MSVLVISFGVLNTDLIAQDDDVEEVVITGTRIQSNDFELNSPVASVSAAQIAETNTINIESLLNQLPQIIPASDRSSNNPGSGAATISLRGLGTTRTLIQLMVKEWYQHSKVELLILIIFQQL